ncbi:type II secretion system protein [Deinococcus koreensis]|uniref:Prepilin-type cleavage/methylation domain-containing protein n=1 Tax=Deinococcus koreensis TaxID=2054903 RepID=A0A2K3UXA7_9DEIO|nr:type II secretion system protein [Deinococcus koreensis]PNY81167.1 prepilin-type cleavage/methylation domain-containing protein [Deinococcus koreensis]
MKGSRPARRRPSGSSSSGLRPSAGFTLVEALVALAVLVIILSFIIPLFISNTQLNTRSERRSQAASAVESALDDLRAQTINTKSGSEDVLKVVGGRTYTVRLVYCRLPALCTENSRMVSATALLDGAPYYEAETVFAEVNYVAP